MYKQKGREPMTDYEVANTPINEEMLRFRIKRLDDQIRVEFDLIGHRMTWLVISQSFLFSAVSLTVNNSVNPSAVKISELLRWLIPIIGIITCISVGLATFAARSVINKLKRQRDPLESQDPTDYQLESIGVRSSSWEHKIGNIPSLILPWVLCIAWFLVFLWNIL
jgi:hypothetical protein